MIHKILFLLALVACGSPAPEPDKTGRVDQAWRQRPGARSTGSLSNQGGAPVTSISGVVDPTNAAFAGGMIPCLSSCSTGLQEQNRAALQSAIDAAVAQRRNLYIPPGQYPIGRKSSAAFSIDFGGAPNIYIDGLGVTLRQSGDATSTDYAMMFVHNTSQVRFRGITFSQRDVTNPTVKTTAILVGDAGATTTDNVVVEDCAFLEGVGGDYVRIDGGSVAETVTQMLFTRNRFENAARAAIDIRPGTRSAIVSYNFFRNNVNRDIYFEPTSDNVIGRFEIVGNTMERTTSTSAVSVTLSGFGSVTNQEQSHFRYNRIYNGTVEAINLDRTFIDANFMEYDRNLGANAMIELSGKVTDVWVLDNYLNRKTGATDGSLIKVTSAGSVSPINVTVRANRAYQFSGASPAIDMSGSSRFMVMENKVSYHAAIADSGATGFVGINCAGTVASACSGVVTRNSVKQDAQDIHSSLNLAAVTTHVNTIVESKQIGTFGNTISLSYVGDSGTTAGSLVETGTGAVLHYRPGFTTITQAEAQITNNSQLIRVKVAGTGSTILQATVDAFVPTNLTGGVQAGRMLTGIKVVVGSGTTINRLSMRDNVVDGAATAYFVDGNGLAAFPEGLPLISGTFRLNGTGDLAGGLATYRAETTIDTETLTSGALSVNRHIAFLSTTGTVNYTLADGVIDGFTKCVKIKAAVGSPVGTLTPTHMADGTTHTISWTAPGGAFCLTWDATAGTYRVASAVTGVTVN